MRRTAVFAALVLSAGLLQAARAAEAPCRLTTRAAAGGMSQALCFNGTAYRDFTQTDAQAHFFISGAAEAASLSYPEGPVSQVTLNPCAEAAEPGSEYEVTVDFRRSPRSSLINIVPAGPEGAGTPQVLAGFSFAPERSAPARPLGGGRKQREADESAAPGEYKLPAMAPAHYSDALVTLKVHNGDFREILWMLSEIGQVSIVLDPYWWQEPTGSKRGVGGGVDGSGGAEGGRGPGFRPGDRFDPGGLSEGRGNLSLDFENVPFDLALDLVLQAVNLVKVDITPESYH